MKVKQNQWSLFSKIFEGFMLVCVWINLVGFFKTLIKNNIYMSINIYLSMTVQISVNSNRYLE